MSANDYPEHLNPFDDNYVGIVEEPLGSHSHKKYNTWSASMSRKVTTLSKRKPSFLEKPWAALNASANGKLVRRLSILKTAVERFASKKSKQLSHSASYTEGDRPPRSHSVHDDFSFRIISPKIKEKIRQQAFSNAINKHEPLDDNPSDAPSSQLNERVPSLTTETNEKTKSDEPCSPASPEPDREVCLGARPKTRKKKPPPPPPPIESSQLDSQIRQINEYDKSEDCTSNNSSITQDLEKDATIEDETTKDEKYTISL